MILTREAIIDTRSATADRTVAVSVSSDYKVERDGYVEILSHVAGAIDLTRSPLPVVEGHDTRKVNVGIVEGLKTDGKKLRGVLRLGNSQRATELWQDIQAGIIRAVSIGYEILQHNITGTTLTATRWKPYEVSLVSVPADPSVGIGRSKTFSFGAINMTTQQNDAAMNGRALAAERDIVNRMANRNTEFTAIRSTYRDMLPDHIDGIIDNALADPAVTLENVQDQILAQLKVLRAPPRNAEPAQGYGERSMYVPDNSTITGGMPVAAREYYGASKRGLSAFGHSPREAHERAYRAGLSLAGVIGNAATKAWVQKRSYGIRAAGGVTDTAGGYLVPDEMSNAIVNNRDMFGAARKLCRIEGMGSDMKRVPIQTGSVVSYYIGENSALSESDLTWGEVSLYAKKLAVLGRFSNECLEDGIIDLASHYANETGRSFAEAEDLAFLTGDGTSTYGGQTGLVTKFEVGSLSGAVSATTGHNLFSEFDAADLTKLIAAVPQYALPGAKWLMSPAFYAAVVQRLIMGLGGVSLSDLVNGQASSFMGYPIELSPKMPSGTATDYVNKAVCLFGDFTKSSILGTRREITVVVDPSRYMEYDQTAVRSTQRWCVVNHDIGTSTVAGPVVALIGA